MHVLSVLCCQCVRSAVSCPCQLCVPETGQAIAETGGLLILGDPPTRPLRGFNCHWLHSLIHFPLKEFFYGFTSHFWPKPDFTHMCCHLKVWTMSQCFAWARMRANQITICAHWIRVLGFLVNSFLN